MNPKRPDTIYIVMENHRWGEILGIFFDAKKAKELMEIHGKGCYIMPKGIDDANESDNDKG